MNSNESKKNKSIKEDNNKTQNDRFMNRVILAQFSVSIILGIFASLGQSWWVYAYKIPLLIFIFGFMVPPPRKDPRTGRLIYPSLSFVLGVLFSLIVFWNRWWLFLVFLVITLLFRDQLKKIVKKKSRNDS